MSIVRLHTATLLVFAVGMTFNLSSLTAQAQNNIADQCINPQTGALIDSQFCKCRMGWDAVHQRFSVRGNAAACVDRGLTTGSIAPAGKSGLDLGKGGGTGGLGAGSGGGPGGEVGGLSGGSGDGGGKVGPNNPGNDQQLGQAGEDPSGKNGGQMGPTGHEGKNN